VKGEPANVYEIIEKAYEYRREKEFEKLFHRNGLDVCLFLITFGA
jgi:hypothetical protein